MCISNKLPIDVGVAGPGPFENHWCWQTTIWLDSCVPCSASRQSRALTEFLLTDPRFFQYPELELGSLPVSVLSYCWQACDPPNLCVSCRARKQRLRKDMSILPSGLTLHSISRNSKLSCERMGVPKQTNKQTRETEQSVSM